MPAPPWFVDRLGWKKATKKATSRCAKYFGKSRGPNLADLSGTSSTRIAGHAYHLLNITRDIEFDLGRYEGMKIRQAEARRSEETAPDADDDAVKVRASGAQLEHDLAEDIQNGLKERSVKTRLSEGQGDWFVTRHGDVSQFTQYEHLADLQRLLEQQDTLRATVGRAYQVSTDIMIGTPSQWAGTRPYMLHAAVSSKLTIRSDRAQNIRVEFGTLVRNRRGRLPHLVVVTAEPLPSRILSLARGTGEIDAVYHLMYHEIDEALGQLRHDDKALGAQWAHWREMVDMRRIRPYGELIDVLAGG